MIKKNDKEIELIKVFYDDGTTKIIEKGAVIELAKNDEEDSLTMEFADIAKIDLMKIIFAIMNLGLESKILD